jgi:hypothetical protein
MEIFKETLSKKFFQEKWYFALDKHFLYVKNDGFSIKLKSNKICGIWFKIIWGKIIKNKRLTRKRKIFL